MVFVYSLQLLTETMSLLLDVFEIECHNKTCELWAVLPTIGRPGTPSFSFHINQQSSIQYILLLHMLRPSSGQSKSTDSRTRQCSYSSNYKSWVALLGSSPPALKSHSLADSKFTQQPWPCFDTSLRIAADILTCAATMTGRRHCLPVLTMPRAPNTLKSQ